MNDELKLLIEWPSPWQEFVDNILPAFSHSPEHLAGEAKTGLFPFRGMLTTWATEALLLIAVIFLPAKLAHMHPYMPPALPKYDVIYYSGNELPRTEDAGGARAGRAGVSGGSQGHHPTQAIRVARGEKLREQIVDAPKLNLPQANSQVANLLAYKPIPGPAPTSGLSSPRTHDLSQAAVAPAPQVQRDRMQQAPTLSANVVPPSVSSPERTVRLPSLNSNVIPPSASAPQREISAYSVPGSNSIQVVPPPVSAPEQTTNLHPRLTLPQSIVAPPPTQVARDLRATGPGFDSGELNRQVVAPTVQVSGDSVNRRSIGGPGNSEVVAPPAQVASNSVGRAAPGLSNSQVVAPAAQVNGTISGRQGAAAGNPTVVPPPADSQGGGFWRSVVAAVTGNSAVPPPPSVKASAAGSGAGSGERGSGFGNMADASAPSPSSSTGGSVAGNGIIVSNTPGSTLGTPSNGGTGSLAMSPSGTAIAGLGGSGGGTGIGKGSGSGNAEAGDGSGAAKSGSGHDAEVMAKAGTSPLPGTGGAGIGARNPAMPGVSVHGGSNIITLPSFGTADPAADPAVPSNKRSHAGPGITIEGSPRSGGAFAMYGALKGDKVYTILIDTALGTAVMEYSDPSSAAHSYAQELTAPQPVLADLPAHLKPSRLVIACVLDRSGALKNPHVLQSGGQEMTTKVLASLAHWKFSPALRGERPVEVDAILGFDVDTN